LAENTVNSYLARFFTQPNAFARLAWLRCSLGLVCAVLVGLGPYGDFYVEAAPFLAPASSWLPALGAVGWYGLRSFVLLASVCAALGVGLRLSLPALALSFGWFNAYAANLENVIFSYNSHLNVFLVALCFVDTSRGASLASATHPGPSAAQTERASFVLSFLQCYVAVLYFQTGLAKLLQGGLAWFTTGQTIYVNALVLGLERGRALASLRWLFPLLGMLTALFEFGFLPLFLWGRGLWLATWVAILFHLGTFLLLGISFWHLWLLYPALFLYAARES
jgi:hypothetical protein